MKLHRKAMALGLISACLVTVNAHARPGAPAPKSNFPIGSIQDLRGQGLHPEWADGNLGASPQDGPYAPPLLDLVLPNTASAAQMTDAGVSGYAQCTQYGGTEKVIQTLTVTPTTPTIAITYFAQANVTGGTVWGGAFFICSVTQASTLPAKAACSQTSGNPALVTRLPISATNRAGFVGMIAYHGYVTGLNPGEPATITISGIALGSSPNPPYTAVVPGLFGQNCYGNITVNY